ncbi:MAG: GC-type dockerin domain-anchored protein, partial [Phycisphaerales bacterium]
PCPGDYNDDGGVDGDDVIAFFADWDTGLIGADLTGDGGVDGDDVIFFFERWDAGC